MINRKASARCIGPALWRLYQKIILVEKNCIVAVSGGQVGSKRKCGQGYIDVSELLLSPHVRKMMEAMSGKSG